MTENFSKFKRKLHSVRLLKSLTAGIAVGAFVGGIFSIAAKRELISVNPLLSILVGAIACLLCGGVVYLLLHTSDKRLAKELDNRFALQEKVQTMLEFRNETGNLPALQREDCEQTLANIPAKQFKPKRLWVYFLALCVGLASLTSSFLVKAKEPPVEKVKPFTISAIQIAGIEELIKYVDNSKMDQPYKLEISSNLSELLVALKAATTEPQMQTALTERMAYIQAATYNSSSMTEILNALWNTQEEYAQGFAKAMDSSTWKEPDWGDFAEKLTGFRQSFEHQNDPDQPAATDEEMLQALKSKLEYFAFKTETALLASNQTQNDPLYAVVRDFALEGNGIPSLGEIAKNTTLISYSQAITALEYTFNEMADDLYAITEQQKLNTNVGEYTMQKLATLFLVPVPPFERPDFSKTNNGQGSDMEEDNSDQPSDGGLGEGQEFGSKDLVLDPETGEYVEYGTLMKKYYQLMFVKLDNGNYTEEQKEIIKNYFALLFSGIKNEDGN